MRKSLLPSVLHLRPFSSPPPGLKTRTKTTLRRSQRRFQRRVSPLSKGSRPAESEGKPISAKFEGEDGALQLSVYTMKGDQFAEVLVDHNSGSIRNSEPITDPDDLKDAKEQGEAMGKAKLSLGAAVASAVKAHYGFLAVSAVPMLDGGQPVASVTLVKDGEVQKVTEKLD